MIEQESRRLEEAVTKLCGLLKEASSWTDRRDAAESLCKSARCAIESIKESAKTKDYDVAVECEKALNELRGTLDLSSIKLVGEPAQPVPKKVDDPLPGDPRDVVRAVAQKRGYVFSESSDGFGFEIDTKGGRHQEVQVRFDAADQTGSPLVQILTLCCAATEQIYRWALQANSRLAHGALALRTTESGEMLALVNTYPAHAVTEKVIEANLEYIAETGDWIEKETTGLDAH